MSDLGGTMNENLRDKIAAALGNHQRHGRGMTYGSPDTCRCDERVYPPKGDADPDVRRDGAFAQHQTDAVLAVVGPQLDRLRAEVERLRAALRQERVMFHAANADCAVLRARLAKAAALLDDWEQKAGPESSAWKAYGPQSVSIPFVLREFRDALASVPEPSDSEPCTTPGCPGDGRYAAPGRRHAVGCKYPQHSDSEPECTCPYTPEDQWLSAASCGYGSGYEPGSMQEFNPECPAHGYPSDSEPAPDADRKAGGE